MRLSAAVWLWGALQLILSQGAEIPEPLRTQAAQTQAAIAGLGPHFAKGEPWLTTLRLRRKHAAELQMSAAQYAVMMKYMEARTDKDNFATIPTEHRLMLGKIVLGTTDVAKRRAQREKRAQEAMMMQMDDSMEEDRSEIDAVEEALDGITDEQVLRFVNGDFSVFGELKPKPDARINGRRSNEL